MTPAINLVIKNKVSHKIHEYSHDKASESYGLAAAKELAVSTDRIFKTLVLSIDNKELVVAILPVSSLLSLKLIAKAVAAKKAFMANKAEVERSTGYVLGGVSPLGQKRRLKTIIDTSAKNFTTVFVSAGRRGLEIELSPGDLTKLTFARLAKICQ